jgi:Isy1-like splicing family
VRELFEKEAPRQVRRTRHQIYQNIDGDYYGFRDEEDGLLVKVEADAEVEMRREVNGGDLSVWAFGGVQVCLGRGWDA